MFEKAKPIEAGCRCLVIKSDNYYMQETVAISKGDGLFSSLGMSLDGHWLTSIKKPGVQKLYFREKYLLRIDDPDIQKQLNEERVVGTVKKQLLPVLTFPQH